MATDTKSSVHTITFALLIVGGLNWLVFGLFGWDISFIFGDSMRNPIAKIIYALFGASALVEIGLHRELCRQCGSRFALKQTSPTGEGKT